MTEELINNVDFHLKLYVLIGVSRHPDFKEQKSLQYMLGMDSDTSNQMNRRKLKLTHVFDITTTPFNAY